MGVVLCYHAVSHDDTSLQTTCGRIVKGRKEGALKQAVFTNGAAPRRALQIQREMQWIVPNSIS